MEKVYIAAARRTAIGSFGGSLSTVPAVEYAAKTARAALDEAGLPAGALDEVVMGHVLTAGSGQGPGRQVALAAGVPQDVPAYSINMVCGSGMKAVMNAATAIRAGTAKAVLAGGTENMSMAPYLIPGARQGLRMGNKELVDHMVYDALTDAYEGTHMGITAENVAEQLGITRQQQDAFAIASQQKAIAAVGSGAFKKEIVPITVKQRREEVVFDTDEYPNRKTSLEKLAALRPAFKKDGTVTAGNASGINDGAAVLVVVGESAVKEYGLKPMAEIVSFGQGGVDPSVMGLGPVPAIVGALRSAGMALGDMQVIELNEAFAAQSLGVVQQLAQQHGLSEDAIMERTNLLGGAIALGHPVGASGARILVTLAHLLQAKKLEYGLASLCIGGGMGTAVILRGV